MAYQIPKELQEKIANFEQLKTQLQMIISQKGELDARKREIDASVEALAENKEGEVYRRIGDILIKVRDRDALTAELKEESETLGVRLKSLESQEKTAREMYENLGREINESLKG
ncbi:MAG TPA: prefoldin subunit beta [Euryarchaeota archaeon]|nr:MAG: prefoldin subunit beta [Thermoplasmatales archaeon ex4484_6]RLF67385.1 MAG: prefoldin subunit beta [Thermoplasmata archaeon]HHD15153.1 prefoldin subunit beta [Euryarchaeota archaeon]